MFTLRAFDSFLCPHGLSRPDRRGLNLSAPCRDGHLRRLSSPADDWIEDDIDLQKILVTNRAATLMWRVEGHSMREAGIFDGDVVLIDRSLSPKDGNVVAVSVNGEVTHDDKG